MKETMRKCSHCGHNGHNSRTCHAKGCFKLFGVNISDQIQDLPSVKKSVKKSYSVGNLQSLGGEFNGHVDEGREFDGDVDEGYLSDGPIHTKHERKRGTWKIYLSNFVLPIFISLILIGSKL